MPGVVITLRDKQPSAWDGRAEPATPRARGSAAFADDPHQPDDRLLDALRAGHPAAQAAFVERFHRYVERLVTRVLGVDHEVPDLVQEVFVAALRGVSRYRGDHGGLPSWLGQIAIRTARQCIRKRRALRWLVVRPIGQLEDAQAAFCSPEDRQVLARTYAALDRLGAEERVVFVLRALEGLEVTEVAALCGVSVATVKRRSKRAHDRFWRMVEHDPVLREWHEAHGKREDQP